MRISVSLATLEVCVNLVGETCLQSSPLRRRRTLATTLYFTRFFNDRISPGWTVPVYVNKEFHLRKFCLQFSKRRLVTVVARVIDPNM